MSRTRKVLLLLSLLVVAIAVTLTLAGPSMQRAVFYPKPRGLPPVVSQTSEQLLARLQAVLETNAPIVAHSLQAGLTEAQIAALEAQGGFHLSDDLRALYRWHNGLATNSFLELLAGQRFIPLEEVVHARALIGQQVASASILQRAAFSLFAGHRTGWIQILDDGAGDGYFYDPQRSDGEGAFFCHFAEMSDYAWFPSFRNFLVGVVECYESQAVKVAADGKSLEEDVLRTEKIWTRLSRTTESRD